MQAEKIKKGLWLFIFACLCAPLVQYCTNIVKSGQLDGYYELAQDATFSKDGWLEGTYQEQKSKYIIDHVGFRTDFVRINSQLYYSVYNMVWGATLGKDDYLYYDDYIRVSLGQDVLPYDKIKDIVVKLKTAQDGLEAKGKHFVFLHSANKAAVYPEYLPRRRKDVRAGPSNREWFNRISDSIGLHYIDFVPMLVAKKMTGPVYTRQGIHWSEYGAMYVVDTLIKYMSKQTGRELTLPQWGNITKTETARGSDNDIGKSLNLAIPIKETFYYPEIKFPVDKGQRLSAIYIGDSFMWPLISDSLMARTHDKWEFWYYFNDVHTEKVMKYEEQAKLMANYDWRKRIDSTDVVLMLYSEHNMHLLDKVVDSLYQYGIMP